MTTTATPHKVTHEGKTFEFTDREKVKKDSTVLESGAIMTRFIFRNGHVATHVMERDHALYARAAMHGLDQKFGDEFAGETDVEDCVEGFDQLSERLAKGEWRERRAEGISGTSLLLRALIEVTGKPKDALKAALKEKAPHQKKALQAQPKVAAVIARLKAERADKSQPIDPKLAEKELQSMFS